MNAPAGTRSAVVVTRAEPPDGPLSTSLRRFGLQVLHWPAVQVSAPGDATALREALARCEDFDWIVFTSRNAVAAVRRHLSRVPASVRVAAVGERTAEALREAGWRVDLVPATASAEALVAAFAEQGCAGARVLFPASSRALPTLPRGLAALGAQVRQVEAYRTEPAGLDVEACRACIERGTVGAVTFASPSAVAGLERALGETDFARLLVGSAAIAIGPTTGRALEERGIEPLLAQTATLAGLADATYRFMQSRH